MPKITSNLENTKVFTPMEDCWVRARITKEPEIEQPDDASEPGAIQIVNSWEVICLEDGSETYKGRKLNFDRVIVGGINPKTSEAYSLNRELMYVGSIGISWTPSCCSNVITGMANKGKLDYTCPQCNAVIPGLEFNTEDCMGKEALVHVTKKQRMGKDNAGKYTLVVKDEDGQLVFDNQISQYKPL